MANQYTHKTHEDRFWSKVCKDPHPKGCWLWIAGVTKEGYGKIWWSNKDERAHRISYILTNGEISDGIYVLHACDNKRCVNPEHLFLSDVLSDAIRHPRKITRVPKEEKYTRPRRSNKKPARIQALDILGDKCVRCGFPDPRALQIDHIEGGGNKERRLYVSTERYYQHIVDVGGNGYQILCANCNQIKKHENKECVGVSQKHSEKLYN